MIKKAIVKDDYWEETLGIYSDDDRSDLVNSGEISPEEDGFMQGYLDAA